MENKILGRYLIEYPDNNVKQEKVLIDYSDLVEIKMMADDDKRKAALKLLTGGAEYFTTNSPLFFAIDSGVVNNYGIHKCIITKI